jgi:hypothetical protein
MPKFLVIMSKMALLFSETSSLVGTVKVTFSVVVFIVICLSLSVKIDDTKVGTSVPSANEPD